MTDPTDVELAFEATQFDITFMSISCTASSKATVPSDDKREHDSKEPPPAIAMLVTESRPLEEDDLLDGNRRDARAARAVGSDASTAARDGN